MTTPPTHHRPATEAPDSDDLLENLVAAFDQVGSGSASVTLWVSGAMISGQLISSKEFFERYGRLWAGAGPTAAKIGEIYTKSAAELHDALKANPNAPPPAFIHLKNARTYVSTRPIPSVGGFLWRGRISEVSAFSIGELGVADEP